MTFNSLLEKVIGEMLGDDIPAAWINSFIDTLDFWSVLYPEADKERLASYARYSKGVAKKILASMTAPKSPQVQAVDEIIAEEEESKSTLSRLAKVVKSGQFVILDTETTGLNGNAEICQIAIIDSDGNTLLNTLVKPQKPIPVGATDIHGITNEMVKDAPSWMDINEQVWGLLAGKTVIVYNAEYDFKMIYQSEKACDSLALSDWHKVKRECAMLAYGEYRGIWNDYFGNWKWHKLSDAAARVGYKLPAGMKAHGALADCLMTLAVCKKIAGL